MIVSETFPGRLIVCILQCQVLSLQLLLQRLHEIARQMQQRQGRGSTVQCKLCSSPPGRRSVIRLAWVLLRRGKASWLRAAAAPGRTELLFGLSPSVLVSCGSSRPHRAAFWLESFCPGVLVRQKAQAKEKEKSQKGLDLASLEANRARSWGSHCSCCRAGRQVLCLGMTRHAGSIASPHLNPREAEKKRRISACGCGSKSSVRARNERSSSFAAWRELGGSLRFRLQVQSSGKVR